MQGGVHGSDHGLVASLPYFGGTPRVLEWTNPLERQSIAAHEIFNDPFGQVVYLSVLAR
jgi:hypothetical protein